MCFLRPLQTCFNRMNYLLKSPSYFQMLFLCKESIFMKVRNLKKILVKKQGHKKQNVASKMVSSICAQSLHALALH